MCPDGRPYGPGGFERDWIAALNRGNAGCPSDWHGVVLAFLADVNCPPIRLEITSFHISRRPQWPRELSSTLSQLQLQQGTKDLLEWWQWRGNTIHPLGGDPMYAYARIRYQTANPSELSDEAQPPIVEIARAFLAKLPSRSHADRVCDIASRLVNHDILETARTYLGPGSPSSRCSPTAASVRAVAHGSHTSTTAPSTRSCSSGGAMAQPPQASPSSAEPSAATCSCSTSTSSGSWTSSTRRRASCCRVPGRRPAEPTCSCGARLRWPATRSSPWRRPHRANRDARRGGYVLAAPSPGYTMVRGDLEHIPVLSDSVVQALLDVARSFNQWVAPEPEPPPKAAPKDTHERAGDRPGDDWAASTSWAAILGRTAGPSSVTATTTTTGAGQQRDARCSRPRPRTGRSTCSAATPLPSRKSAATPNSPPTPSSSMPATGGCHPGARGARLWRATATA